MKKAPRSAAGGAFLKRLILPALVGLSVYFALFGGEYSVFEVRRVRVENLELEQRLIESERANDSLRTWAEALETDSATTARDDSGRGGPLPYRPSTHRRRNRRRSGLGTGSGASLRLPTCRADAPDHFSSPSSPSGAP